MSLYGVLRTGVSGMTAQSNKLGTVADNIANSGTAGYKRASTEFSSLLLQSSSGEYNSGAVNTKLRYAISEQGAPKYTTSPTDLMVQGNGFFYVSDANGKNYVTRAGNFVLDASSGNLVNAAGFSLLGYDISSGDPDVSLNGTSGLVPVHLSGETMSGNPTTEGALSATLPEGATVVAAANLPSANAATAEYSAKSSVEVYDKTGNKITLDIYYSKTGSNTWEMSIFDRADADATSGDFPYAGGDLATTTLTFDADGQLTTSPATISVAVPNGNTVPIDLTGMTQLAEDYTPLKADFDGSSPSLVSDVLIDSDGIVYGVDDQGRKQAMYQIPLVKVASPDNLQPEAGNVFSATNESGDFQIGFANEGGMGTIISNATEQSNVDMASELTEMIVAQRDYTANSKVFQTGTDLLDVLMNLKR